MSLIKFELFQDADAHEMAILYHMVCASDNSAHYGEMIRLTDEEFRRRGLNVILGILDRSRVDSELLVTTHSDNMVWRNLYKKKFRYNKIDFSRDCRQATITTMHYDDHWDVGPICGERTNIGLDIGSEEFAKTVMDAIAKSEDFKWVESVFDGCQAIFDIYRNSGNDVLTWFDWVRLSLPTIEGDVLTAWNYPRSFQRGTLAGQFRQLAVESLQQFSRRQRRQNLNPRPRGSQVADTGAYAEQRVVVYQREDPRLVFMRPFFYDPDDLSQIDSGLEFRIPIDADETVFFRVFMDAISHCAS
ncbi:hypothetical protein ACYOEI_05235 [Singulisphaera rosea]